MTFDGLTRLPLTLFDQDVLSVPEYQSGPTPNHHLTTKPRAFVLGNAPLVSPSIVIVFFSQVLAESIV